MPRARVGPDRLVHPRLEVRLMHETNPNEAWQGVGALCAGILIERHHVGAVEKSSFVAPWRVIVIGTRAQVLWNGRHCSVILALLSLPGFSALRLSQLVVRWGMAAMSCSVSCPVPYSPKLRQLQLASPSRTQHCGGSRCRSSVSRGG